VESNNKAAAMWFSFRHWWYLEAFKL